MKIKLNLSDLDLILHFHTLIQFFIFLVVLIIFPYWIILLICQKILLILVYIILQIYLFNPFINLQNAIIQRVYLKSLF